MDIAELKTTADLAQLELDDQELVRLQEAVEQMLENFAKMEELDVERLAPTTHALIQDNPLREDEPVPTSDTKKLVDKAPESDDDFFVIPNVL